MMTGAECRRPGWVALAMVIALGAFLRFWNLSSGLPYRVGADEPIIAEHALQIMKTGDFNPHFFDYPGLYIYVQVLVGCVRFLAGASNGLWRSLDQFLPDHFFLWTRALNAALGTLTVAVVYFVGLRWGRWVALLAAVVMAVWPNHVRESHFALTDVPLTLLTITALLFSLRARETGTLTWLAAAGASVGLAAATKYTGALALIMPLIAAITIREPRRVWQHTGVVVGAATVAFLAGAPYTVLDLPGFLNAFAVLGTAYRPRPFTGGASIYIGHLKTAAGWPGVIAAAAGVAWGVVRAVSERSVTKWALLIIFPLAFFDFVATKNLIFGRYLLPLIPFLSLLMAIVLVDAATWLLLSLHQPRWARIAAATAIVGGTLVPVTAAGVAWPREYGAKVTQDAAYRTIHAVVPTGSMVVVGCPDLRLPASEYRALQTTNLTARSPEEYVSAGATFLVASSEALGAALASRSSSAQAYRALLEDSGRCLPPIKPTTDMSGPQIWICRLQTP